MKSSTTSSVVAIEMLGILLTSWPRNVGLFETDGETKLATSVCKGASSTQRGRQTVVGQHLTGRGLPRLRRAVAAQWDTMILQPSETVRTTWTYINWSELITRNCCLPYWLRRCEQRHWSDLSRAQAWAVYMEILGCPVVRIPLSASLM